MADLVKQVIDIGFKIKDLVEKFRNNNNDCRKMFDFVDALSKELELMQAVPAMEDPSVRDAVGRLKVALEDTEAKVRKCRSASALLRVFQADQIATTLEKLKKDVLDKMHDVHRQISISTNTTVHVVAGKVDQGFNSINENMGIQNAFIFRLAEDFSGMLFRQGRMEQLLMDIFSTDNAVSKHDVVGRGKCMASSSSAPRQAEDSEGTSAGGEERRYYKVLTEDNLRARQREDTNKVCKALSVPSGAAALLLRHCHWTQETMQRQWLEDGAAFREVVGLPDDDSWPKFIEDSDLMCGICLDDGVDVAGRMMRSAGCSHYYCEECWRGYLQEALRDSARCLSLQCPDPSCTVAVLQEMVVEVVGAADMARYNRFELWSYVEASGGRIKWCPGLDCGRAVEFLGRDGDSTHVLCKCGHAFCWSCGEEPHHPLSCGAACLWLAIVDTIRSDSCWIRTYTKHCPRCGRRVENNGRTNHVTCSAPCRHRFCWICLRSLGTNSDHETDHGCGSIRDFWDWWLQLPEKVRGKLTENGEEKRRAIFKTMEEDKRRAKDSKHYKRWVANETSLKSALTDMKELKCSWLSTMARTLGIGVDDLKFLTQAYEQVVEGRRVIGWVYAYRYFLLELERFFPGQCEQFDDMLSKVDDSLKCLGTTVDEEKVNLCAAEVEAISEAFPASKNRLVVLTRKVREHIEKLMKDVETGEWAPGVLFQLRNNSGAPLLL